MRIRLLDLADNYLCSILHCRRSKMLTVLEQHCQPQGHPEHTVRHYETPDIVQSLREEVITYRMLAGR